MSKVFSNLNSIFTKYNKSIVNNNTNSNQKFLVYSIERSKMIKGSHYVGGLADRIKGLISIFYISILTGRRFTIHWDNPLDILEGLQPNKYDWKFSNAEKFIKNKSRFLHLDYIGRGDALNDLNYRKIEKDLFKGEDVVIMNANSFCVDAMSAYIKKEFGGMCWYGQYFNEAFEFLFKFAPLDQFSSSRLKFDDFKVGADLVVAVHLRTGAGNGWKDPILDEWENYELILERAFSLARAHGATKPVFYFVSDSLEARSAVAAKKWEFPIFVEQEGTSHLDRSAGINDSNHHRTFFEFQLLGEADMVVCGQGGFAQMAALSRGKKYFRYKDT